MIRTSTADFESAIINITVERNGADTPGSGTVVFAYTLETEDVAFYSPITISAGDSPPTADVMAGQIRYTIYISAFNTETTVLAGPVTFNGLALPGIPSRNRISMDRPQQVQQLNP
ncbi:hypothetical protein CGZ75_06500 [Paenibacillus herberti]|uniref:Uncharacterized protein n=2 Tax=Paenibacillus herberti TaxID=1619309 RepID=A0A229P2P6_9BACL|nr:hypothetical protein CGZ75_06500 [Paenibacillus herberti]